MKSLSTAYMARRFAGAKSKCAHGGPVHCMEGCYAKGGMVEKEGDLNSEMEALDADEAPSAENEESDQEEMETMKKSSVLGRILGSIHKFHKNA